MKNSAKMRFNQGHLNRQCLYVALTRGLALRQNRYFLPSKSKVAADGIEAF
jgi:hypothetical protein